MHHYPPGVIYYTTATIGTSEQGRRDEIRNRSARYAFMNK